jgi:hypothetical protein
MQTAKPSPSLLGLKAEVHGDFDEQAAEANLDMTKNHRKMVEEMKQTH